MKKRYPNQTAHNFRASKHRYEKYQRPLVRAVRLLVGLVELAVWIFVHRTGKQKRRARDWLMWICAKGWHLLLSAMLGDWADEVLSGLTRPHDNENAESEMTTAQHSS